MLVHNLSSIRLSNFQQALLWCTLPIQSLGVFYHSDDQGEAYTAFNAPFIDTSWESNIKPWAQVELKMVIKYPSYVWDYKH